MTAAIDRVAQAAAGTGANVVTLRSERGPHTIEGALDAALGVAGMLEVVAAYTQPFDAVVVAPGLWLTIVLLFRCFWMRKNPQECIQLPLIFEGACKPRGITAVARVDP